MGRSIFCFCCSCCLANFCSWDIGDGWPGVFSCAFLVGAQRLNISDNNNIFVVHGNACTLIYARALPRVERTCFIVSLSVLFVWVSLFGIRAVAGLVYCVEKKTGEKEVLCVFQSEKH